jgi:DNA repair exonuclease SbcCD ATPase subunit
MLIQELRNKLERQKGKKLQLDSNLNSLKEDLKDSKRSLHRHEQAREIIREVGLKTQQQLQFHISDITSLALESVFPDPYELKVNFIQRRNKTECDLLFVRDDMELDPAEESGVGPVDIASFALRIASWSMQKPHSRNTIILDEPFKCLSDDFQEKASTMIKQISQKLGIQFIIVTHEPILASYADKIFEVKKSRKTKRSNITTS